MATQLATTEQAQPTANMSAEQQHFGLMQRKAALYASSPLIPETLRQGGQQAALANCYIGLSIAERMGENELTVLQNIHIVKGKAGFSAQFMIARANASGVFKGRINWRMTGQGETLCAEAYATLADTGEEVSFAVDMGMAKAEGWTSNPKYKSVPHLMLRYRSATFLIRLYAPDVMFGYRTSDEVEDMGFAEAPVVASQPLTAAMLTDQASGDPEPDHEPEGPADTDRGERLTLDQAMVIIDRCETVIDVNAKLEALCPDLSEEDGDELHVHAGVRKAELGAK
ncbi:hypothetical protein [Sphingobium abikonense]|uniref:hypothetical protein n=1 Tax=Sphingobium abikonense TaxID=86193 RepID=UPI003514BA44